MFQEKQLKARITELELALITQAEAILSDGRAHTVAIANLMSIHEQEIAGLKAGHVSASDFLKGQIEALNRWGKQRDFMLQFGPYHMAGKGEINGVTFQLIEGRVDYHQANFRLPIPDGEVSL